MGASFPCSHGVFSPASLARSFSSMASAVLILLHQCQGWALLMTDPQHNNMKTLIRPTGKQPAGFIG